MNESFAIIWIMRGASGIFLLASWKSAGFSLFLWLGLILIVFFLFHCIKALLLGIKEQGLSLLHLGDSRRPEDEVCRLRHRRHAYRHRDPDVYTINCPPVLQSSTLRHHGTQDLTRIHQNITNFHQTRSSDITSHDNQTSERPTSSPPIIQPDMNYILPNTPSSEPEPPPYSSLYSEEPPAYESLYNTKDTKISPV